MRTFLSLALFAGACVASQPGGIDYSVSGGFGGGGNDTPPMHIDPDGRVTRALPGGPKVTLLAPSETASLYRKVRDAEFATLAPQYDECCDGYVHEVRVQLDGTAYTVEASELARIPDRLQVVIDALQDIARR